MSVYELHHFEPLTGGLYSGDPVTLRLGFIVYNNSFWRHLPWSVRMVATLNGIRGEAVVAGTGDTVHRNDFELPFVGHMPSGKHLSGEITFFASMPYHPNPWDRRWREVGTERIGIANWDDEVAPPDDPMPPPAICTEGQTRCRDYHLEKCVQGRWQIEKYWAEECGWTPTPPDPPDPPPAPQPPAPPGPPDIPGWFDRNKHIIIPIAVAALVIALIAIIAKTRPGIRSPVKGFRSPIYTRRK